MTKPPKDGIGVYADGWNDCLRAVRAFLEELAEGRGTGGDTIIFQTLHKIVARAGRPHTWEPLSLLYDSHSLTDNMPCGLCGKGVGDAIHNVHNVRKT